jgi:hypothetical protein
MDLGFSRLALGEKGFVERSGFLLAGAAGIIDGLEADRAGFFEGLFEGLAGAAVGQLSEAAGAVLGV